MDPIDAVIASAVARLRDVEPEAIAVLVAGSYATGAADELSDLDLKAIVERCASCYHTWFQERPGGRSLHVSAGVYTVQEWRDRRHAPTWSGALGLPVLEPARYAWATDEARRLIGDDPSIRRPAGPPELEDFFEFSVKVKRGAAAGDALGLRVWARAAAELAPRLLVPLNKHPLVSGHREAVEAALALPVAPEHWAEDLSVCLGLVSADDTQLAISALRLGRELLAFLREHKPDVDPQPDLVRCLSDGTLERQLAS